MKEIYFLHCFIPLGQEKELDGEALEPVTKELALSFMASSTGRAWMARDAHVSLTEMRSKNDAALYGCAVQWHSDFQGRRMIDFDQVVQFYGEFLREQVGEGTLQEIKRCDEAGGGLLWVFESRLPRSRPFRTVLSYRPKIDFLLLVAAETDVVGDPEPCPY